MIEIRELRSLAFGRLKMHYKHTSGGARYSRSCNDYYLRLVGDNYLHRFQGGFEVGEVLPGHVGSRTVANRSVYTQATKTNQQRTNTQLIGTTPPISRIPKEQPTTPLQLLSTLL